MAPPRSVHSGDRRWLSQERASLPEDDAADTSRRGNTALRVRALEHGQVAAGLQGPHDIGPPAQADRNVLRETRQEDLERRMLVLDLDELSADVVEDEEDHRREATALGKL